MSNRLNELRNLSPEQLFARASNVLPPWVALALVVVIAWQLVRITWLLFPQSNASLVMPEETQAPRQAAANVSSYDTGKIIAANLFGIQLEEDIEPVTGPVEDLDDTQLNLTLRGTIAATDDRAGLAIIANDRGEEKVYAVGDPISGGRTLHSVQPDQAILNHNGILEALRLPKEFQAQVTSSRSSRNSRNSRQSSVARPSPAGRELQALAANPTKLTDLIRPQPVFSNGKQLGYRVYPGRRRQQFVSLGLKPGDLVTEINGSPLNDPAKGAEIFKSLADSNQVTVTVERNGSPQVLVLDTEQLNNLQGGQER